MYLDSKTTLDLIQIQRVLYHPQKRTSISFENVCETTSIHGCPRKDGLPFLRKILYIQNDEARCGVAAEPQGPRRPKAECGPRRPTNDGVFAESRFLLSYCDSIHRVAFEVSLKKHIGKALSHRVQRKHDLL
ncbi:unnamed protein product [Cylicocyclus nassatus]|uniref:Uncharacterized protein n=1 Tax=Cylicocyclus nassatus TaxID=53992 RepID=A0AA36DUL6_CYLNA|nr:unnamed protein product [Cylicocyclus nassatus]